MFGLIFLPLLFVVSMAQIPLPGPCNLTPMENLNGSQIMGTWYEYIRYPMSYESRCETEHIAQQPDGTMILTAKYAPLNATNEIVTIRARMPLSGAQVQLISLESSQLLMNIRILSTDYESYVITGACVNHGPMSMYNYWAFGRSIERSQSVMAKIYQIIEYHEIPLQYFQVMNQTGCVDF